MNHCWIQRATIAASNEGRACELSRRLTVAVLFARDGAPGPWLLLLGGLWGAVAAITLGTPG